MRSNAHTKSPHEHKTAPDHSQGSATATGTPPENSSADASPVIDFAAWLWRDCSRRMGGR